MPDPTGGIIETDSVDYRIHRFLADGTFSVSEELTVEFVLVAGGGTGGSDTPGTSPGGGGGGGIVLGTALLTPGDYPVAVGAGGSYTNPLENSYTRVNGVDGDDSTAFGFLAIGGGGGGHYAGVGRTGGSGGGAGDYVTASVYTGGAATLNQGHPGGSGSPDGNAGGGGGGAGGPGISGSIGVQGPGGPALATWAGVFASGGGASAYPVDYPPWEPQHEPDNTGNGSGGRTSGLAPGYFGIANSGGSGIVVVRYVTGTGGGGGGAGSLRLGNRLGRRGIRL